MEHQDSHGELGLYGAFYTHTKPPAGRADPNRESAVGGWCQFAALSRAPVTI